MDDESKAQPSAARYAAVWIALLALTGLTFATSKVDLGQWNLPVALLIATAKAGLVVLFFMHLWDSRGTNRLVLGVSVLFVLLLIAGVVGDVATRFPLARPPEATGLQHPGEELQDRGAQHGGEKEREP